MQGVGLDESRPVVSVHGAPPGRRDGGRRADENEASRDGTASTRRARRTMAPAKKGARARARRNLCEAFVAFARSSRLDGARATEDSREGFATDDDG